jgi:hypothetical protein
MRVGTRYLLMNPFCMGPVRHSADLYPGQHEPLINLEPWDRVQAIRARRGAGKGDGRKADCIHLLARLARCAK